MKPVRRGPRQRAPKHPRTPGERIWALRERLGYTQEELAAKIGARQQTVANWEKDFVRPGSGNWRHLERILGQSREALEFGKGYRLPAADQAAEARTVITLPDMPPIPEGAAVLKLDRKDLVIEPLRPKEAVAALREALKAGRPIWLVMG